MDMEKVKVAAVQAAPVFLDARATVDRAGELIGEAAANGARLIVFPEAFIPAYPDWAWRSKPWDEGAHWFGRFLEQAVIVPGPMTELLGRAALRAHAYVAIGVDERDPVGSTVFNTLLYFGPDGRLLGKHRKLMPTGPERTVWGSGDGSTLPLIVDTPFGRVGGLICWENYMPLARAAMYAAGVDIWVAPTWDRGDVWVSTLRHIAKEGRVEVIGVACCLRESDIPADIEGRDALYGGGDDWINEGWSAIVRHSGEVLAGPLVGETGILYAELDAAAARASRKEFDSVGHYSRPDVFQLRVNTRPTVAVSFGGDPDDGLLSVPARMAADHKQRRVGGSNRTKRPKSEANMSAGTVSKLEARSHDKPDEVRRPDKATVEVNNIGDFTIGRFTFQPGWSWASSIKPVAKTEHCEKTHVGYAVSGQMETWMTDGTRITIKPGDSYTIPPGHDARVLGAEPFVGIEFASAATYAKR